MKTSCYCIPMLLLSIALLFNCNHAFAERIEIKRGVNISHWLSQSEARGEERKAWFTRDDVKQLAELGFDHLRIPIDEEQMFLENGKKDKEAFELLHKGLGWCAEFGLKAVVDLHILRSHHFNAEEKPLFTEKAAQKRFYECWKLISGELKKYPVSMLAYELMNEPVADEPEIWNTIVNECLTEVRKYEKNRTVIIGSNRWQNFATVKDLKLPEKDKNLIISFHYYEPFMLTHYKALWTDMRHYPGPVHYPGLLVLPEEMNTLPASAKERFGWAANTTYDYARIESEFQQVADVAAKWGLPVYCGEFGCIKGAPEADMYAWYRDMASLFDKFGFAFATWDYKGGFGIKREGEWVWPIIEPLTKKTGSSSTSTLALNVASVDDFLNSIGVNSTISRRAESLEKTIETTRYMGIRWVRTGYESGIPVSDLVELYEKAGVKSSYGLLSGGNDLNRLLNGARQLAKAGALLAVEGLNEPNNWGTTYNGKRGGGNRDTWVPIAEIQRDLYKAVKSDPELKSYPVWSLSENGAQTDNTGLQFLTIPEGAGTVMPAGTVYADYANCHNYVNHPSWPGLRDNQTWLSASPGRDCPVDGLYGNYGVTWAKKFKGYSELELESLPRVTTETGLKIEGEITEEKHSRLLVNLYLSQFARGWSHTAVYLLRDRSDEDGNQQYGFYTPDYKPRPAALYMHNLTSILGGNKLSGSGNNGNTSATMQQSSELPDYEIAGITDTEHDILLRKNDGGYILIIWGEKAKGTTNVTVKFSKAPKSVKVYNPLEGKQVIKEYKNLSGGVPLTLSDHPFVLEF